MRRRYRIHEPHAAHDRASNQKIVDIFEGTRPALSHLSEIS